MMGSHDNFDSRAGEGFLITHQNLSGSFLFSIPSQLLCDGGQGLKPIQSRLCNNFLQRTATMELAGLSGLNPWGYDATAPMALLTSHKTGWRTHSDNSVESALLDFGFSLSN